MKIKGQEVLAYARVGSKSLFVNNAFGLLKEIKPLCLYDFFVFPSN